jgi:hypothetical protein
MKESISRDDVLDLIMKSAPEDYTWDDYDGLYVYNSDINLRISLEDSDEINAPFEEPWISKLSVHKEGQSGIGRCGPILTSCEGMGRAPLCSSMDLMRNE